MNITEHPPEKKIVIRKFNFSCDEPDDSIPPPLPNILNFAWFICGRPGSSKTTLVLNLLCKQGKNYNGKFDKVYIISPSLGTMEGNPFGSIPEEQMYNELSLETLESILGEIGETGEKVLVVMDDCVNDMRKNKKVETLLAKCLMNRRHLCGYGGSASFMITSQVYNKIPAPVRKTASHLTVYHTKNKRELDTIFDETILIPKTDFYKILNHCFKSKYDFCHMDLNKPFNEMFYHNFNRLTFRTTDEEKNIR